MRKDRSPHVYFFFVFQLTKPLMEKRRRARINACLNQLKNLVLEAMNQNVRHL